MLRFFSSSTTHSNDRAKDGELADPSKPLMKREEVSPPQVIILNKHWLVLEKHADGFMGTGTERGQDWMAVDVGVFHD